LAPIEKILQSFLNPVGVKLQVFSGRINLFYRRQTNQEDLSAKAESLSKELEILIVENAALKKMEEENTKLRQYLNFFNNQNDLKRVMANVVARESLDESGVLGDFIIDRGLSDGLYPGLAAVNERGALVGKIITVEEKSARLILTTGADCHLAAAVLNGGRTIGTTSGNLNLTINLNFVPQTAEVEKGDVIITSGLESGVPAGLAIGRIISVDKGTNEIWQKVVAEPVVDFDDVFMIAVILP
jgi:rod shape-determining protein MreC